MVCSFCSDPAHGLCSFPVERFVETEVGEFKVGDIVRRFKPSPRDETSLATVRKLSKLDNEMIEVTLSIRSNHGALRPKVFEANTFSRLRALRRVPCGAPVCHAHLAARGPVVYVCRDHFNAWQEIS